MNRIREAFRSNVHPGGILYVFRRTLFIASAILGLCNSAHAFTIKGKKA